jgi:hypothetical protein
MANIPDYLLLRRSMAHHMPCGNAQGSQSTSLAGRRLMIMSTISSFDDALDFYPATKSAPATRGLLAARLRALWVAMSEGQAAASRYHQLVARGRSADAAASQVFAEFYAH